MNQFFYRKKNKKNRTWILIPLVISFLLTGFLLDKTSQASEIATNIGSQIHRITNRLTHSESIQRNNEQKYFNSEDLLNLFQEPGKLVVEAEKTPKNIQAEAYLVADVKTGQILFSQNTEKILPIASITKLMTASVTLEEIQPTTQIQVSAQAFGSPGEGGRGQLRLHEKIEVSDLLYPLLLVSSNDASEVLAEALGRNNFIKKMNEQARNLSMSNTIFDDPSGLSSKNISTVLDLFTLTQHLYQNHPTVFEITKLRQYSQGNRTWTNSNRYSGNENYHGGKTGFTNKAKRTGIALFSIPFEGYGERTIALIVLRTDNRVEDYTNLLSAVKSGVRYETYESELYKKYQNTPSHLTLSFVGDMMFDRGVKSSVYKNFEGSYDALFTNLKPIFEMSDIVFGNLEGPISDKGRNVGSKYSFRFEPQVAQSLKNNKFSIVSFANNHVGDWSIEAFEDTLHYLEEAGVLFTGAGKNLQEAESPTIIEKHGIKIGFLGFSDVGPIWMEAKENQAGQLLASNPNRIQIIEKAKKQSDILIVSYHWGNEYVPHNERQELLAKSSIDAGADIIIGHHPHIIQDIEEYKTGVIAYSLGNAIFDQHFSKETMEGALLQIQVTKDGVKNYHKKIFNISNQYQPQKPE